MSQACQKTLHYAVVLFLYLSLTSTLVAQSPEDAFPIVLGIRVNGDCLGGVLLSVPRESGAAVVFGVSGDTIYAVTARHLVAGNITGCQVESIEARIYPMSLPGFARRVPAVIADSGDPSLDLAIITMIVPKDSTNFFVVERPLASNGKVFLIGCPLGGDCWEAPLEARLRQRRSVLRDSMNLVAQSALIEAGYSGGPAVDGSGALVGITVGYGGQNVHIRGWTRTKEWIAVYCLS